MEDLISTAGAWLVAGGGAGGGFFMVKWFVEWLGGRLDKREAVIATRDARLDDSTQKLIGKLEERMVHLTERLDRVEDELIECRAAHAQCESELTRLKAIMQGWGDAKDHAQSIIAAQRLMDRKDTQ